MNDRNNIVNEIEDRIGAEGDTELAERVFEILRTDDQIYYAGDYEGLKIREDADLVEAVDEALKTEA